MKNRVTGVASRCLFRCQNRALPRITGQGTQYSTQWPRVPFVPVSREVTGTGLHHQTQENAFEAYRHLQRRYFSNSKVRSSLTDESNQPTDLPPRLYQQKTNNFLHQAKSGRVKPELVAQKVEELLLLSLSEYEDNVPSDGPLALELLNIALRYTKQQEVAERLIPRLFSLSCQLMLKSGNPAAASEVHNQLWRLLNGHREFLDPNETLYNTNHVNDACSYFIRRIVSDANKRKQKLEFRRSRKLHRLIERLTELQKDPSVPLASNPYIDDALILLLCNQLKPKEAHEVLRRRVEKASSASPTAREGEIPLASSFTAIINGYAKTSQPDKAESIIKWMISFQEATDPSSLTTTKGLPPSVVPPPNLNCFNGLLHAHAMTGTKNAGYKVEQILDWMEELFETMALDTKPNETTYNICINAWAKSKHPEAPLRAENLLRRMVGLGESGTQIEPSEEAFTAVMNTWINSNSSSGSKKKMREATEKVAGILDLMERISETSSSLFLSVVPYTVLIKAWGKVGENMNEIEKQNCCDEILNVLSRMSSKGVIPTTETYNSTITALAEISPIAAVFYFLELEQQYCGGKLQLDTRTFNCGLNAIAVLNRPDAVDKVTGILKRMFEYHESDPSILPSNLTFNIILKVLSRSTSHVPGAAAKADDLLSEMDEMESVVPDFISYVTCIMAWGRSDEDDKIQRVTNLLQRYISSLKDHGEHVRTNIAVFNAVLSVCHHNSSTDKYVDDALHTTKTTMLELRKQKGIVPDQKTYKSFFQVMKVGSIVDNTSTSSFTGLIEDEFNQCVSDGYVTKDIILAFHGAVPYTTFERIVGENVDPRAFSIPKAWCRNSAIQ